MRQDFPFVHRNFQALLLAVYRAGRRRDLKVLTWAMPAGILAQAVVGGITVLAGLAWWTVALHLLPSMVLAWLAAVLFVRIGEGDRSPARRVVPAPLTWLTVLSAVLLSGVIVTGTMVTGAGPHAGDARVEAGDRLQLPIQWLVHFHAELMVGYVCLLIGLLLGLIALRAQGPAIRRSAILIGLIAAQAILGITQYQLGVPELLVVVGRLVSSNDLASAPSGNVLACELGDVIVTWYSVSRPPVVIGSSHDTHSDPVVCPTGV